MFQYCHRFVVIGIVTAFFVVGADTELMGQGNSELLAPATNMELQLACAEVTEDGKINIIRSTSGFVAEKIESSADADSGNAETANEADHKDVKETMVTQTYQVRVPYTEQVVVDGKTTSVLRYRTEMRTRRIAVADAKNKQMATYQVEVPYMESVVGANGQVTTVTRMRLETRTRMIGKDERLVKKVSPVKSPVDVSKLKFYKLDGTNLPPKEAMRRFSERLPVILLVEDKPLGEFYRQLLRPETILIFNESESDSASTREVDR